LVLPVAALYAVFGPAPVLAVGYVLLCSLAVVPVAGALAWASSRRRWASVLAMGLAALLPTLVFTASGLWSEPPALLLTLVSLLLLVRSEGRFDRVGTAALAGLALAVAYLNRPSVGLVIALVFAWLVVDGLFVTRRWRESLPRAAVFALVAALPILAWGARNQRALGGFYLGNTESTAALWGSNNPVTAGLEPPALARVGEYDLEREAAEGRYLGSWVPLSYLEGEAPSRPGGAAELERHRRQQRRVREFVFEHPWAWLRLLGYKGWRILTAEPMAPSILGEDPGMRRLKRVVTFAERWFVLLAGGYGMALLARRRPRHAILYGIYAAAGLAVVFLAYPNARIFLPVSVALLPPAAVALAELGERAAK
jgi:4-amino-4-deoxy-L-arabinose transferase-like glycosyltransferase